MLVNRSTLSAHRGWIAFVLTATAAALAWWLAEGWGASRFPGGSSRPGLVLGTIAAAIMVFEVLLWPRKRLRAWRIGRAQTWLRAHIWLGLWTVPLVALHSGGSLGGQLSMLLTIVFAVVIASGVWGLAMQQYLPRLMLDRVPAETVYLEIDTQAAQNRRDARELVHAVCGALPGVPRDEVEEEGVEFRHVAVGSYRALGKTKGKVLQTRSLPPTSANAEALALAFSEVIDPYLAQGGRGRRSVLKDEMQASNYFRELRTKLDPPVGNVVDEIEGLCRLRRQFDLQVTLHHWLHGWLLLHAPLSIMLLALLVIHIYVAVKYW